MDLGTVIYDVNFFVYFEIRSFDVDSTWDCCYWFTIDIYYVEHFVTLDFHMFSNYDFVNVYFYDWRDVLTDFKLFVLDYININEEKWFFRVISTFFTHFTHT